MKNAFLDQLFLGFLLLMSIATFVATVNDEASTRNRIFDLKALTETTSEAVARYYEQQIDMCTAQVIANDILEKSPLGKMVIDNNLVSYLWEDTDSDGEPDQITTTIAAHDHATFWYRLFNKDAFQIGPFSSDPETINTPVTVNISFGSEDAGYRNMAGTYTLDENNCVQDPKIILDDSKGSDAVPGQSLGSEITSPPTYLFLIADGYNSFTRNGNHPNENDTVTIDHCFDDVTNNTSNPTVEINNKTVNNTNMYFEHTELNGDGNYEHFQIIPKNIWEEYNDFLDNTVASNAKDKYQQFVDHADTLNSDADSTNDINYTKDPNDEYYYAMEDLNQGGDQDFNDLVLDSTRVVIPNQLNTFTVNNDGSISLTCDNNQNPIVNITCPAPIYEDTSYEFNFTAIDNDGSITTSTASATNGNAIANSSSVSYTPNSHYFGTDRITLQVTDNEGAVGFGYCDMNVIEVNDIPTIAGIPTTSINAGSLYNFLPIADDTPDKDVSNNILVFSIQNKPSWATFDTTTGQLAGIPSNSDKGTYTNIVITVSDGRGGTTSLNPFSIEVIEGNGTPILVLPIADQTVQEGDSFSYNASPHFSDPDNDPLTYTISALLNGNTLSGFSITNNGQISSITIPNGNVGKIITLTITASDGSSSISDTFNLTITNSTDIPVFNFTFDSDEEGWEGYSSWEKYNNDGKLKITATNVKTVTTVYKTINFGPDFANRNINIDLDMYHSGGWESSGGSQDYFAVVVDGTIVEGWHSYGSTNNGTHGPQHYTIKTEKTDSNGMIVLQFAIYVSYTGETAYIDNVVIELQ